MFFRPVRPPFEGTIPSQVPVCEQSKRPVRSEKDSSETHLLVRQAPYCVLYSAVDDDRRGW